MPDLNNRTLAMQAARKIVEASPIGKALGTETESPQRMEDQSRKEKMTKEIAKLIEETYAPWCNEEFK